MRLRTLRYLQLKYFFPVAWMLVIFLLSHEAAGDSTARSDVIVNLLGGLGLDWAVDSVTVVVRKTAHLAAYAVLGGLFFWSLSDKGVMLRNVVVASVLLSFVFAVTDEMHQAYIPGRSGEVGDVLIDTIGATIGAVLAYYVAVWLRSRRRSK